MAPWCYFGRLEDMKAIPLLSRRSILVFLALAAFVTLPALAFTANSLDLAVDKSGDATATFQFTLEGLVENAIPQSMLQDELLKGMGTSSDPPQLISMDRSTAVIRMKKFAEMKDVPTGTEYTTASMNFKKAQIALQNSALSSVVSADFSPAKIVVTFPDKFSRQFSNSDVLPSITHTIVDPSKKAAADAAAAAAATNATSPVTTPRPTTGTIKVVSSPADVMVSLDGELMGTAPDTFAEIAPGRHTLQFTKENYAPASKTVNVTAGQTVQVSVFLAYIEPVPTQSPGFTGILAGLALGIGALVGMRRRPA
jgi:hypothetical protein